MIKINQFIFLIIMAYMGGAWANILPKKTSGLIKAATKVRSYRGPAHIELLKRVKFLEAIAGQYLPVSLEKLQGYENIRLDEDPVFKIPSHNLAKYKDHIPVLSLHFQNLPLEIKLAILEVYHDNIYSDDYWFDGDIKDGAALFFSYFLSNDTIYNFLQNLFQRKSFAYNHFYAKFIKIFIKNKMVPEFFFDISQWHSSESLDLFCTTKKGSIKRWNPKLEEKINAMREGSDNWLGDSDDFTILDFLNLAQTGTLDGYHNFSYVLNKQGLIEIRNRYLKFIGKLSKKDIKFLKTYWEKVQAI
jgi:hypothetical protein